MTLRSTARATYHVALDFWGCLRRFVDGKAVNGYDDHMAGLLAEAGGKQAGRDFAAELAEREAQTEVAEPPYGLPIDLQAGDRAAVQLTDGSLVHGVYDPSMPGLIDTDFERWNESARREAMARARTAGAFGDDEPSCTCALGGPFRDICPTHYEHKTSAAPGTASPVAAAESPASSDTAASAAADAGHLTSSAAHSQTADERPGATPLASGPPTFTASELVDAAGAVTRMALVRGIASGNVAHWLALSAKFYDAADAIGDASTPPEYTTQLATIGRDALLETLANDPDSVHDRALRHEDERQK